uniref:Putative secreted protein n=1 Tax=Amblyomma cajennense TaxID=34607 RepID=A0A023FFX6_AMBCJ
MLFAAVICATLAVLITGDAHPQPQDDITAPPVDDDPDCNEQRRADHVLKKCTLKCDGDMLVPLNGSERCDLSDAQQMGPEPVPVERTEAQIKTGVCQDGDCVEKPEDF